MSTSDLTHRDRAILRAVAAGRCKFTGGPCAALTIDGLSCCDQFAGPRLTQAGLIVSSHTEPARLTETGQALLEAA